MSSKANPARSDCAVVLTVDAKFLPYGLFLIDQIARTIPERQFDLCILTTAAALSHPLIQEHGVRVVSLPPNVMQADFPHSDRISIATYLRFYIASQLGDDYRRVLYLDSDIYFRRGDLDRLLRADIGTKPLAGARDPIQFRRPKFVHRDMKQLGFDRFPYLSAGVQLIDTAQFRAQRIAEQAVELASSRPNDMLVYDQTALNGVLQGNFAELPPVWNWLYGFRTMFLTELYDPPFLHFAGRRKPWGPINGQIPARYIEAYQSFFRQHFPQLVDTVPPPVAPSQSKAAHLTGC